jgi:hypothetical protein
MKKIGLPTKVFFTIAILLSILLVIGGIFTNDTVNLSVAIGILVGALTVATFVYDKPLWMKTAFVVALLSFLYAFIPGAGDDGFIIKVPHMDFTVNILVNIIVCGLAGALIGVFIEAAISNKK